MSNISPGPRWLKAWIVILFTLFSLSIAHIPAAFAAVSSAADPALQLKIVSTRVNLRAGPGTNFAVIGGASQDEQFAVIGRNAQGTWYKINLSGGKTAWVNGGLVTIPGDASQIPVVKEDAPSTPAASNAGPGTHAEHAWRVLNERGRDTAAPGLPQRNPGVGAPGSPGRKLRSSFRGGR